MIHKITIENFFSIADIQELIFEVPRNAPDLACFKSSRSKEDVRLPTVVDYIAIHRIFSQICVA